MTKTVLLYGDSIFWGVDATTGQRHERANRVDTIVQQMLGDDVEVVGEGFRGRTMFGENGFFPERDGLAQFGPIFASHLPIDVVVIMLGTNDLNSKALHPANEIAESIPKYVEKMQYWCDFMGFSLPSLLIVSPPDVDQQSIKKFSEVFAGTVDRIAPAVDALQQVAQRDGHAFLDSRQIARSINTDGIHLDAAETKKLADAITAQVVALLAD